MGTSSFTAFRQYEHCYKKADYFKGLQKLITLSAWLAGSYLGVDAQQENS